MFILRSSPNGHLDQQHQQIHTTVHPKIKPQRPFGSTTSINPHNCSSQDQAPTALGSTIIHLQDQAPTALGSTIHQFKIKPRRPLKKAPSFIIRSSKIKPRRPLDQQHQQIHTSNRSSRSSPKALEDPFITVIQDQTLTALEETLILKIKPQWLFEDPLKSTFKDQAHGPLKKLPTVHPRSSLDGPWINETSINQHLTEIESDDQN
ncbi:hypothetical protein ACFX1Q_008529 [Malus domestica]